MSVPIQPTLTLTHRYGPVMMLATLLPPRWVLWAILVPCLAQAVIESDTSFYGESDPVYPSPPGTGTGDWAAAYAKANAFVAQLSLDEKSNLTYGITSLTNGCSGNIPPITRLGFPGMCLQDAGNGVRGTDFVNGYPSALHIGASWNRNLANQRGVYMGNEFYRKGVNVALGPVVGPLGRVAEGGRNWEGFTNDPYLGGALVAETVRGIQSNGVITSTKVRASPNSLGIGKDAEMD